MKLSRTFKITVLSISVLAASAISFSVNSSAQVTSCKPVPAKGKTVGKIIVDGVNLPIKSFTYPLGGVMEPQGSTLMAALSKRHMPLSSSMGSSIIVWHRDFAGCTNDLNVILKHEIGSIFKVTDEKGKTKKYQITYMGDVSKGDYDKNWFTLIGPRQLVLVTCTGDFLNGHYEKNVVIVANPA